MSSHAQRRRRQQRRDIRSGAIEAAAGRPAISAEMIHAEAAVEWIQAAADAPADRPKSFSMTAYTGGELRVSRYGDPVVIDLEGLKAEAQIPALRDHDPTQIVGHTEAVEIAGKVRIQGVVSGGGAAAQEVLAAAKQGFPWRASVGAMPDEGGLEYIAAGVSTKVNGKTFRGPLMVARRATLREVSFVAVGADGKTKVTVAASAAVHSPKDKVMDPKLQAWIEAMGLVVAELRDDQVAKLKAAHDRQIKAEAERAKAVEGAAAPAPIQAAVPAFDLAAVGLTCAKHQTAIEAKAAEYAGKIDEPKLAELRNAATKAGLDIKAQALQEQWATPRLEAALVLAAANHEVGLMRAERPKAPAIHASSRDTQPQVIEAALCMAAGLRGVERVFRPEILEAAHAYHRRDGASLQGLILAAAAANGYAGARRIHRGNYDEVMAAVRQAPIQAGGFSTHSLTTLLSTVGNKFILEGFNEVEQVWREIAAIRPVNDFKQITAYRMLDDGVFEEVGADGEIHHGTLSQESYTNQAKTYAKMLAITRTDFINDDLGAFDSLRDRFGANSGRKLNSVFWAAFLDDATFFNATATTVAGGHDNLITNALGEAGIAAAVVKLAKTDANGHPLGLGGIQHLLLTGATLNPTARKWYVSQEMRDTTSSTKSPTANIYQNTYRPVMSAYITDTSDWYLLPVGGGSLAPMEVAFLNGVQTPTIESSEMDFNMLGVQFRGYFDFGVSQKEWRAAVKSTGAG